MGDNAGVGAGTGAGARAMGIGIIKIEFWILFCLFGYIFDVKM